MSEPHACISCLRRASLVGRLAPCIERSASGGPSKAIFELLRLSSEDLVATVAPSTAEQILAQAEAASEERLRSDIDAARCWAVCHHDRLYPQGLRLSIDGPWVLFGRGDPQLLERLYPGEVITLVGSRRAATYGREVAHELARELGAAGAVVSSGMALGIDACAHGGALETGLTVAVLGCGPDISYPAVHRSLWRRIGEAGLVLSELPPGTGAWRWTFPARNRLLAGIAGVTVVIEAAVRSGSLITAERASDLGRVVGAVPGPVNARGSAGTNQLLAGGARVVRDANDVLEDLSGISGGHAGDGS
jgi:DNA processing protein